MVSAVGPVDHLPRTPLPWRTAADRTECGKPISDFEPSRIISVATLERRIQDMGKQRAAFTACMTCMSTADRWRNREGRSGPIEGIVREFEGLQWASPPPRDPTARRGEEAARTWARKQRAIAELEAIAALVTAHRDEFDGYLAGLADTTSLAAARRKRSAR